jgi:hypothetical protein
MTESDKRLRAAVEHVAMAEGGGDVDTELAEHLAESVGGPGAEGPCNRREYPREAYRTVRRIAPYDSSVFPSESDFYPVLCHDLSRGGFCFFHTSRPGFAGLVVELAAGLRSIYAVARVVHCRQVLLDARGNARPLTKALDRTLRTSSLTGVPGFLVGCQFVRAVRPGSLPRE